ncbi:enoyl-CoA hydratase/isomerase family protein [Sphingopyxis terrae]|uniref:enoyl-CoA hydratase/isomerase family protein n=1 Tax=Sphingopyxis terrae TaxID=33052 RepID=UPI002A105F3C|nr:enoyl-CoA hydratase/isomerase family protein [Sphingopyxis terrae]MDX8356429.1 enoyl-CoA hydratase/isomerase family protein [Sphingopyxis terrae]
MKACQDIVLSIEDRRADIQLNLPASHNALTYRMIAELKEAIACIRATPDVAVLVLSGAGRSFCSGDNLKDMGETPHGGDLLATTTSDSYQAVVEALRGLPMPVMTLGHGHVLGAGLELFMAGDIKLATREASFGIPFARLGLAAMNYHLPRQIGFTRAARMLFTGDPIDGGMAVDWGLATEVVDGDAQLQERAAHWADRFRGLSTHSIATMKQTFYQAYETEERHWYMWWTAQWINFLDRQRAAGNGWPKA